MKGVILAGGTAFRLHPLTQVSNKHLFQVHDRLMMYFPVQTLRGIGIGTVMAILGRRSIGYIVELLSDGKEFGPDLTYRFERGAVDIAHPIALAREIVGKNPSGWCSATTS